MARRVRDNVAPLRRSSAGWMPARIGQWSAGVKAGIQSQFVRRRWWLGQWGGCEHYGTSQERSTLLLNGTGLRWLFAKLQPQQNSQNQQAASRVRRVMLAFCEMTRGVSDTRKSCPTLLRGIWARSKLAAFRRLKLTFSSRLAWVLLRFAFAEHSLRCLPVSISR